ncbi:LLM class flavin-dependent oxidoreductase [Sporosarcina sp. P13]|uniref:LLM class flavin-dependent oxidoreductase n=1 Tax=Sporosarcina sp. P13 TaxID=2048263 RepID=UPI000C16CA2D|nr:LLM class flavin-dependent oxidoreductase [Sporosarcina sp. P13]PIC63236.1 LLM class flavin-dependent oxidoreductase [Sporosarcina sp. P13]
MKFSIFANLSGRDRIDEFDKVLDEVREQAVYCDENGYEAIWFTEHHFGHEGFELIANPILMGADIAARTKRIRIGQAANVITFWHPLRLAEDIAMLDQLSQGRVDVGLARGLYGREAANLNPLADRKNDAQNRAIYEETVEILKKALSNKFFSHKGEFYEFPPKGLKWNHPLSPSTSEFMNMDTNEIEKISIIPPPKQKDHPPFWQMVESQRSIEEAARNELNAVLWMPTLEHLKERFKIYQETLSAVKGKPVAMGEGLGLVRPVYVAETMEQAREDAEQAVLENYKWVSHWRGLTPLLNPGEVVGNEQELDFDFLNPRNLIFGTPEQVTEKIQELKDELNLQNLLLWVNLSGLPHEKMMKSLKLFTEKVMPNFVEQTTTEKIGGSADAKSSQVVYSN